MKTLLRVLQVRAGEGRLLALVAGLGFLVSTGGSLGGNGVEALFFARFGVDYLPALYMALGVSTLLATVLFAGLVSRGARGRLYISIALVLAVVLAGERGLLELGQRWVYPVVWLSMNLIGTIQGLLIWGLAALVCDTRQAKRLFPIIGAAGVLGGVVGGLATRPLAGLLHSENLLVIWSACLLAGFGLGLLLLRMPAAAEPPARRASFLRDVGQGLRTVRGSPLLTWLAVAAILFSVLYFSLSFPFARAVTAQFPQPDDLAGFLGLFQAASTGAAFLVSLLLANRIYARFGLMTSVLVFPVIYLFGFALLALYPAFPALVGFRFVQMAYLFGIAGAAYHTVMNVIPGERREQARAFIEGVGTQAGIVLGGLLLLVGQQALQPRQVYLVGLVAAALTVAVVWLARRYYGGALLAALRTGQPDIFAVEPHPLGGVPSDGRALALVEEALAGDDPRLRRVAVQIAAQLELPESMPRVVGLVDDPDPHVSAAAARATGSFDRLRAMARDSDPTTQAAGVGELAERPQPDDADLFAERLTDPSAAVRRAAAAGLVRAAPERALPALLPLLAETDASVSDAAAAAVAELGVRCQAELLAALSEPGFEDAALAGLERLPSSPREPVLAYLGQRAGEALELSNQAADLAGAAEPASLLVRSLRRLAERQATRAVRAAGLLADRQSAMAAARGLLSHSAVQRANALEALESLRPGNLIKPLVQVWEPAEARAGRNGGASHAAAALRDHDDAWIRECAAFVAASLDGGEMAKTLATLPLMERILFLSQVGLFSDMPPADLKQVAGVAGEQAFHDGAQLARQDQPGEEMFIIISGAVRVLRDGKQIAVRQPGEHVGEMAILTGEPRSASLVAEGETRTLVVDRPHFESIIRERPETAMAVIRTLAARLEERF